MKKVQQGRHKKLKKALQKRSQRNRKLANKRAQTVVQDSGARVIRHARDYPIEGCRVQRDWQDSGLAVVVIARTQPTGDMVFANYLVDYYCLGVRDTVSYAGVPSDEFVNEVLPRIYRGIPPADISPALAHEIVYGAVEYAAQFGFNPHRRFRLSQFVLDPPDERPRSGTVEFGKNGKPYYVSGSRDNVGAIMGRLARTAGEGNFDHALSGDALDSPMANGEDAQTEPSSPLWVPGMEREAAREDDEPRSALWTPGR